MDIHELQLNYWISLIGPFPEIVLFSLSLSFTITDVMPDKPPHIAALRWPLMKLGTFSTTKDFGCDEQIY